MRKNKKIRLYGLGNEANFNYYIFDKKNNVYYLLVKILRDIFGLYLETYDENNKEINIERYKDLYKGRVVHVDYKSRVDIFYGNKKMFIVLHCPPKLRLKFNAELFKIAKMSKQAKLKIKK